MINLKEKITKFVKKFFIIFLLYLLSPSVAYSSQIDLKKPYFTNHDIWVNDLNRQKPPFLSKAEREKWVPPLTKVKTFLHLYNLYDLNHNNQTFSLHGEISMSWNGKVLGWQGNEEEKIWIGFNSINNYDFKQSDWYEPYTDANNNNAVSISFDGNFNAKFDYKKFPFDDQVLRIEYEANTDAYEIILKQYDNVTIESDFNKILDYNIDEVKVENKIKIYPTTFGISDYDPGETYASSLVRTSIILKKSYINSFLIYIVPLLLISLLLLMNATRLSFDKGVKLSLPPASLLAIIFLQNDLNQTLPELSYLTYLHYLYIYSYILVFLCFLEAIFSYDEEFNMSEKSIYFIRRNILIILMNFVVFILPPVTYFLI